MSSLATTDRPLRVAVIGAGPAGLYAAEALLKKQDLVVSVDVFNRFPTPFGLVRDGVAPDHQSIKAVARVLGETLADPRVRLFGNVTYGVDVHHKELKRFYDQIVYAVGAQADRRMSIPGEDLPNSFAAISFVGWYNGHPTTVSSRSTSPASGPSWSATATWPWTWPGCWSPPRRRCGGPTWPAMPWRRWAGAGSARWWCWGDGARPRRPSPRPSCASWGSWTGWTWSSTPATSSSTRPARPRPPRTGRPGRTSSTCRPTPPPPGGRGPAASSCASWPPRWRSWGRRGRIAALRMEQNELVVDAFGGLRSKGTGRFEVIEAGLVVRSIGYRTVPIEGVPFDPATSTIDNIAGQVVHPNTGEVVAGEYAAGWAKRGPTGRIGNNKPDSASTVEAMVADLPALKGIRDDHRDPSRIAAFLRQRGIDYVSFQDWQVLDAHEVALGAGQGRPRVKLTTVPEMLEVIRRSR